jgi:hypothetical protein
MESGDYHPMIGDDFHPKMDPYRHPKINTYFQPVIRLIYIQKRPTDSHPMIKTDFQSKRHTECHPMIETEYQSKLILIYIQWSLLIFIQPLLLLFILRSADSATFLVRLISHKSRLITSLILSSYMILIIILSRLIFILQ